MLTFINRAISVILITLLSACSYTKNETSVSKLPMKVDDPRIEVNTMTSATVTMTGYSNIPMNDPALSAPRATDKQSMENIMNNPGLAQCEKITDTQLKEKCTDNVSYTKATLAKNSKLCNEIKNKRIIGACIVNSIDISLSDKNTNPCTMVDPEIQRGCLDTFIVQQALFTNNSALCVKITDPLEQKKCKTTVIMTQVIKNKDESICIKLDDPLEQKNCNDMFDQQSNIKMILNQ